MALTRWLNSLKRPSRRTRTNHRRKARRARFAVEPLEDRTLLSIFTVNSLADTNDTLAGDGVAVDAFGNTTLRAAIEEANALSGPDTINFNIVGAGPHTIAPGSPLPTVTEAVTVDGTTQPGYAGTPLVELDGSSAGAGASGLRINAGNSTVKGLAVNRFDEAGILLQIGGSNLIALNHLGTDPSGTVALANGSGVMILDSAHNKIGDPFLAGAGSNVISGNTANNVFISGAASTGNRVQSNSIGLDVTGTAALGGNFGVTLVGGATGNVIGGSHALQRNDISGNSRGVGIGSDAPGNIVIGNLIGPDSSGTVGVGNTVNGVVVGSSGNAIWDNVISANPNAGVLLSGAAATGNFVWRNNIGTSAVPVTGGSVIPLPNGFGVLLEFGASGNQIGGMGSNKGNVIAFNNLDGVRVVGDTSDANSILGNAIHSNGWLGIDLGGDGVTGNDAGDGDGGPNDRQNFPVLSAVQAGSSTLVLGQLNSLASTPFHVEVFANAAADPSGHGEGERLLGDFIVWTDAAGNAVFSELLTGASTAGEAISATATRLDNAGPVVVPVPLETSEFSAAVAATPGMLAFLHPVSGVLEVYGTENADALRLGVADDGAIALQDVSNPLLPVPVPIHPPDPVDPPDPIIPAADEIVQIIISLREGDDGFTLMGDPRLQANFDVDGAEGSDGFDLNIFGFNPQPEPPKLVYNVHAGEGNNVVDLNISSAPADGRPAEFNVFAEAGSTNSLNFALSGGQVAGPLELNYFGGSETDNVAVFVQPNEIVEGASLVFNIDSGQGANSLNFDLSGGVIEGAVELNYLGGDDGDALGIIVNDTKPGSEASLTFNVDAGDGDNMLNFQARGNDNIGCIERLNYVGGDGTDLIDLDVSGASPADPTAPVPELAFDLRTGGGADQVTAAFDGLVDTVLDFEAMLGDGPDTLVKTLTGIAGAGGSIDIRAFGEGGDDDMTVRYGYFEGGYGVLDSPLNVLVEGGGGFDRISKQFAHVVTRAPLNVVAVGGSGPDEITGLYEHVHFEAPHTVGLFGDHRTGGADAGGDDELTLLYEAVSFTAAAPVGQVMVGGDGDDELTYALNDEAEALDLTLLIDAGAGNDEVSALLDVTTDALTADIGIHLGAGDDEAVFALLLSPLTAAPVVDVNMVIDGEDGNDAIVAEVVLPEGTTGTLHVAVQGEDDDELELAVFGAKSIADLLLLLDGGP